MIGIWANVAAIIVGTVIGWVFKKVLTDKYGIAADRISSVGYGAAQPVADNKTVEGRAQNRRTMAVAAGEVKVTVKQ